jgi:hypothetical protein
MNNKTILMAAVLAIATVVAAGLTVLPSSVQEAQANPCSNNVDDDSDQSAVGGDGDQKCIGYFPLFEEEE